MDILTLDFNDAWFAWGIGLIIAFPLTVVLLGEIIHQLDQRNSRWIPLLRQVQRYIIPLLVISLIMTHVLELGTEHIAVKIISTFYWILVIYATVSFVNLTLFSDTEGSTWKIKVPKLLLDFARGIIIALGSAMVLSYVWGFELGKMLAALGVGSIVLGLALQDTLSSLVSGFSLVSSRQFIVGDWLKVGDDVGKIIDINWRTVTLVNRDDDVIIIPNSDLAKNKFVNFSHPYPHHHERVNFDFSFDDAPYLVKEALYEAAVETPGILSDPEPVIFLISYDEFSVRHQIKFVIADYGDLPTIRNQFISSVWYVAARKGLTFPTRAHDVFIQKSSNEIQNDENDRKYQILATSPLLKDKNKKILRKIAEHSHVYTYGKDEAIVKQGKESDQFFIMLEGNAIETYTNSDGISHQISSVEQGDFFGLVSLVCDDVDKVSVITRCDSDVLAVDEHSTRELLSIHPELASEIERIIERQQEELNIYMDDPNSNKGST